MEQRPKRFSDCLDIEDLRVAAKRRAHPMVFDYIDGAAGEEKTMARNAAGFEDYFIAHRVLRSVAQIDASCEVMGHELGIPFFPSPAAGNRLFHTQGERAVAEIAGDFRTAYCLSTLSSVSIEDIAKITDGPKWFQLYVWKDRGLVKEMIERARAAGFTALILTVDFPITGYRKRDIRNGFTIPPKTGFKQVIGGLLHPFWTKDYVFGPPIKYANLDAKTPAVSLSDFVAQQLSAEFNWDDATWLLEEWNGPAMIKGVVRADDARQAVDLGFRSVCVSNHGGRQLDGSLAPIDALPAIYAEVGDDCDLILDGGIRSGSDVIKALALGAKAVSFARPYLYGLAAGGSDGVRRAFEIISDDLARDLALAGISSLEEIDRSTVDRVLRMNRNSLR